MDLSDLDRSVQRALLDHWTEKEINGRLGDPEYFFDHVVNPHFDYLRRSGKSAPRIRLKRIPSGELRAVLSE